MKVEQVLGRERPPSKGMQPAELTAQSLPRDNHPLFSRLRNFGDTVIAKDNVGSSQPPPLRWSCLFVDSRPERNVYKHVLR